MPFPFILLLLAASRMAFTEQMLLSAFILPTQPLYPPS